MFPASKRVAILSKGPSLVPFSDTFDRADGVLGGSWDYTAGVWTISSNQAVGTPATLGANLIVNGTFDTDANWTKGTGWTIDTGDSNVAEKALSAAGPLTAIVAPLTAHRFYYTTADFVVTGASFSFNIGGRASRLYGTTASVTDVGLSGSTAFSVGSSATCAGTVDNVTCQLMTTSELIASVDCKGSNANVSAEITAGNSAWMGVIARLDSQTNPQNYLLAYLHPAAATVNRVSLVKVVGGTSTVLISAGSITYGAGKVLMIKCNGVSVELWYDGAQVGTTQALVPGTDDVLIAGKRYGIFSSSGAAAFRIDDFSVVKYS